MTPTLTEPASGRCRTTPAAGGAQGFLICPCLPALSALRAEPAPVPAPRHGIYAATSEDEANQSEKATRASQCPRGATTPKEDRHETRLRKPVQQDPAARRVTRAFLPVNSRPAPAGRAFLPGSGGVSRATRSVRGEPTTEPTHHPSTVKIGDCDVLAHVLVVGDPAAAMDARALAPVPGARDARRGRGNDLPNGAPQRSGRCMGDMASQANLDQSRGIASPRLVSPLSGPCCATFTRPSRADGGCYPQGCRPRSTDPSADTQARVAEWTDAAAQGRGREAFRVRDPARACRAHSLHLSAEVA